MTVAAGLYAQGGRRTRGEIGCHDRRRTAQKGKGVGPHPRIAHRKQLRDTVLPLLDQDLDRIAPALRRGPFGQRAEWHLAPPIGALSAPLFDPPRHVSKIGGSCHALPLDGSHATRTSTVPTPEKLAQARSPGASGNWRTREPVITTSPARRLRPYSPSLRASQATEFSGWSSTAAPTPVATILPFSSTRAST